MSSGATFVKIDKMKHSPDGDYSLVIEGNTVLVPLFHMYLALLFLNTFTILICVFQIPLENLSFLPLSPHFAFMTAWDVIGGWMIWELLL